MPTLSLQLTQLSDVAFQEIQNVNPDFSMKTNDILSTQTSDQLDKWIMDNVEINLYS